MVIHDDWMIWEYPHEGNSHITCLPNMGRLNGENNENQQMRKGHLHGRVGRFVFMVEFVLPKVMDSKNVCPISDQFLLSTCAKIQPFPTRWCPPSCVYWFITISIAIIKYIYIIKLSTNKPQTLVIRHHKPNSHWSYRNQRCYFGAGVSPWTNPYLDGDQILKASQSLDMSLNLPMHLG